ncbi:Ca2+ transporter [Trichoderma citrinoviride]|uniref:Ca2+ transporter n=1 Tax=Trichoderma citrinoviride TaxID=58853 RepID=A0A2T4BN95_9HYPO|nr:Ca2+ transporter [Trichoderma citrinoviride]PTB70756.1 Ca2+ transporter [Trichoderma citrinoviride]
MSSFNHADIKRKAHLVSRQSGESWNFFRHLSWDSNKRRSQTWDGARLEAQREDNVAGEDLTHAATYPANNSIPLRDTSTSGTGKQSGEYNHDRPLIAPPATDADGLRNRGKGDRDEAQTAAAAAAAAEEPNNTKPEKKKSGLIRHVQPKEPFTVANQLQRTLLNSWINVLLVAAPVGIALNYIKSVDRIAVFVVNFIAIVPLAALLSFATEEIALRTGETLGGLLNATFGNAVELIVAVIALIDHKVAIVQTSLIGSILSNLLLVMGFCFFFGGLRRPEQYFNTTVAQTAASMLALAAASVIVPTVFDAAANTPTDKVAKLSRGTAVILLIVYAAYLAFQLGTHQAVFSEQSQKVPAKPWSSGSANHDIKQGLLLPGSVVTRGIVNKEGEPKLVNPEDDEEEEEPQLHFYVAVGLLAGATAIIALCAEFMVGSIDAITANGGLSEEFVGLILLPIVGNAAEHATAVTVAVKDKMDLAIGVAVGSSMQVALFLIPLLVVIGWGMGIEEMNLSFDTFQVAVMFVAVLLVNYLIGDGKSHWLEGWLLICLYAIIAVCAFWYPDQDTGAES